jgi:hypothetical protein
MKYRICIDTDGKISVETSNTSGPSCLKVSELVRDATGGTLSSLQHKQEFYEPEGHLTQDQSQPQSLEQSI